MRFDRFAVVACACVVGLLCASGTARAAVTMTFGTAAPTADGADQANFVDDATVPGGAFNQQAFSDNAGPPGQTFTTPAGALPLALNSISLKGANTGGGNSGGNVFAAGTTWGLRVSTVSGTTLTPVRTYSAIPTVTGSAGNEWFTFSFTGPDVLALAADTQHAFEVFSSAGYLGFDAGLDPTSYPGGFAFNTTGSARQFNSTTAQDRGYDRTFHVDLTPIPEPASAALACVAAAALLRRRRRA